MAFKKFISNWSGDLFYGEKALAYYWAEAGVQSGRMGIGYLSRENYYLTFSNDTAHFNYLIQNNLPLEINKSYQIDLNLKHFKVDGFRVFARLFESRHVEWTAGVSRLYGSRLYDGTLKGVVISTSEKDYDYQNMNIDYFYSRDVIFERELDSPEGDGYAFDTELFWQPDKRLTVKFEMHDIAARIKWRKTPRTKARLDSDNKTYDENGYVTVHPALSGRHSFESYTQKLPWFASFDTELKLLPNAALLFSILALDTKHYHSAGVAWWPKNTVRLHTTYTAGEGALQIGVGTRYLNFGLGFNHVDLYKAKRLLLNFDVKLPLN